MRSSRRFRSVRHGVVAALIGALLTGLLAVHFSREQDAEVVRELERTSGEIEDQISRRVAVAEAALLTLAAELGAGEPPPGRVQQVLRRTAVVEEVPGLLALVWAEQGTSLDGAEAPVSPVAVHPYAPNTAVLGRDLLQDPVRRRAIEVARDEARTTATTVVTHVDGGVDAILLVAPVHRLRVESVAARRLHFRGVIIAVVSPSALFADAADMPVDVRVQDLGATTQDAEAGAVLWATDPAPGPGASTSEVAVADRTWEVALAPGQDFPVAGRDVVVVITAGVLLSLLLGVLVWVLSDRREALEALVAARTAELERSNEELEVASRLQTQFISTISHELRTPLTSVLGFVQTLLRADDISDRERRQFLLRVERNAQTLRRMIEDLLDFGRMERGEQPLERSRTDVGRAVVEIVRDLQPTLGDRRVQLRVQRHCFADVDRVALEHVVRNLISNALRYAPDAGPIEMEVHQVDDRVEVRCCDRGPGFLEEDLPVLCERFVRGTGVMGDGTGIGLALVRELVLAHEGDLTLGNRPGGGAEVIVDLPAAEPSPAPDADQLRRATVLEIG